MPTLYDEYAVAFEQTRAALRAGNGVQLGTIRQTLAKFLPMPRTAALIGFYDAVDGRPIRARVHFDRMQLRTAHSSTQPPSASAPETTSLASARER